MLKRILATVAFVAAACSGQAQAGAQSGSADANAPQVADDARPVYRIVYTRQPHLKDPVPGVPDSELSNFQYASDVRRINDLLAQADLVIDALDGVTPPKVVFDCTGNDEYNCVAQEGRVSPDGRRIAYSVGFAAPGAAGRSGEYDGRIQGLRGLVCAQIYIYDIATDTSTPVPNHPGGDCELNTDSPKAIDRQPAWLSNEEIVFVSNRGGKWPNREVENLHLEYCAARNPACVSQTYPYGHDGKSMQLWKMNVATGEAWNWGPQDLNSLAPEVMTNGDVLYSCYNAHAEKGVSPGGSSLIALPNLYWLCRVDGNGADMTVKLHGHKQNILKAREWLPREPRIGGLTAKKGGLINPEELRGLRSVAEIFRDRIAITSYYRANHNGSLGAIYEFDIGLPHVEGCSTAACLRYPDASARGNEPGSGAFLPPDIRSLTPWGQSGDAMPGFLYLGEGIPYRSAGKAGYPAPWDADSYLITHALGQCYAAASGVQLTRQFLGESTTCRRRIMLVKAPDGANKAAPVTTNPFDPAQMTPLVDDPDYQIWDAKPIKTYMALFGQEAPLRPAPLNPDDGCFLQVVDARASELFSRPADFPQKTATTRCAWQGCAVQPYNENPAYIRDNMAYFSVRLPALFDFSYQDDNERYKMTMNTGGYMGMRFQQRVPLQPDGSVRMQVPCETPLLMAGENARGEVIAMDDTLHSLRRGETRTCHGCHDAHSVERNAQLGGLSAVERFAKTLAHGMEAPLATPVEVPRFDVIQPILTRTCGSCHTGFENDALLYSRVAWDRAQQDFRDWLPIVPVMANNPDKLLWRPLTSRFVSKFALESPLYWYAANQRMDGRGNGARNWDIDFHEGHPDAGVTPAELLLLRDWLDNGAPF